MRILNIISQKPYATGSGVYLSEIMREFQGLNHMQALVCGINKDEPTFEEYKSKTNAKIYPVFFNSKELPFDIFGMSDTMPYQSRMFKTMTTQEKNLYEKGFLNTIKKAIFEFEPDIIICHHLYFLTALVIENFPNENIVAISHGTCIRQLKNIDFEKKRIINSIQKLKTVFALQSIQKEDIKQIFGISDKKIHIIGNGYNPNIFNLNRNLDTSITNDFCTDKNKISDDYSLSTKTNIELNNAEKISEFSGSDITSINKADNNCSNENISAMNNLSNTTDKTNILSNSLKLSKNIVVKLAYAGKISTSKGIKALINAINQVEYPLELNLAGGSGNENEYEEIRSLAKKSRHKIKFLGHMSQQELASLYEKSHLFVFPSFYEGLGLSIIEAMACGLDIVVSNTEGLQEWIYSKMSNPPIIFVDLPKMKNADEPFETELPYYENRLANAINKQIENLINKKFEKNNIDMSEFSWKKIAETIIVKS